MKLLIVILNYRVTDLTIGCLRSLAPRIDRVPDAKVVVCENGSGGDAAERLRQTIELNGWRRWVDLTAVHPNLGFTGGNNIVIRRALASSHPPQYVLLLNSDTIVQDGSLESLVDFMDRHPRAGIGGSRLLSPDGEVQGSPFRFPSVIAEFAGALRLGLFDRFLGTSARLIPSPSQASEVDWVSGASMILRRELLEEIGLLDEGLYTYFDDVDICLRARKAGWETWFIPESQVVHLEGAATGMSTGGRKRIPDYYWQARRRFFLKNYGSLYTALVDAGRIVASALWRLRRRIQRKPDPDPPCLLLDIVRYSVFGAGFKVTEVPNPALPPGTTITTSTM